MFQFHVHFSRPSSKLGMYITISPIAGIDCIPVKTTNEFSALIGQHKPEQVIFQVGLQFPQRPVEISNPKLYQHIDKMIRLWNKHAVAEVL